MPTRKLLDIKSVSKGAAERTPTSQYSRYRLGPTTEILGIPLSRCRVDLVASPADQND